MKKYINVLQLMSWIALFFVSFSACGSEVGQDKQERKFYILPSSLNSSSNFKLFLPKVHPKNLAVKNPKGDWIYVVKDQSDIKGLLDFPDNSNFILNAGNLMGVQFINGKPEKRNVFSVKGNYAFYFADNLEAKPENTFSFKIDVNYED